MEGDLDVEGSEAIVLANAPVAAFDVALVEALESGIGADGHKGRRLDNAVRRGDAADASA